MSEEHSLLPFDDGSHIIRRQWHDGRWFFSVIDIIVILTNSEAPRQYWQDTKKRMIADGWDEPSGKILQLKLVAADGKMRSTDCADAETMLRIVQSISGPKAEALKQWLAEVGYQKLEETAADLTEDQWRLLLRREVADKNLLLAEVAQQSGVITRRDFAIFTDHRYRGLYNGLTSSSVAEVMGLEPGQRPLDWMRPTTLGANLFSITLAAGMLQQNPRETKEEANGVAYKAGRIVRNAIEEAGVPLPEDEPKADRSIQEIERDEHLRLTREAKARHQPALFDVPESQE